MALSLACTLAVSLPRSISRRRLGCVSGSNEVEGLAFTQNTLYVAGGFSIAGSAPADNIAAWDGASWSSLGGGSQGTNGEVSALTVDGSNVYVGGSFTQAGGLAVNHIAHWDGAAWNAIGSGVNSGDGVSSISVDGLYVDGSDLYVMGGFAKAGDAFSNLLARLDLTPADIVVTNTNDSGAGSFRQALQDVERHGTITFDPGLGSITLTPANQYDLTGLVNVTIDGDSDDDLIPDVTIDGTTLESLSEGTESLL